MLPNSKANNYFNKNNYNNNNNDENENLRKEFVFVTPQEQSVMNEINSLKHDLNEYLNECTNVQNRNKNTIISTIKKLENCGKLIKESIDNSINTLKKKVTLTFCLCFVFCCFVFSKHQFKYVFC